MDNKPPCDVCRTINLAKPIRIEKPEMGLYEKFTPAKKFDCSRISERPIVPHCIKVCTKESLEAKAVKSVGSPPYAHGKLMWGVKAGVLAGALYFTYSQGVWSSQKDAMECLDRWAEYIKSINTRRPPDFDKCGRVIRKDVGGSLLQPMYIIYKECITTCFSGIVKLPVVIKCTYVAYLDALEKQWKAAAFERKKN